MPGSDSPTPVAEQYPLDVSDVAEQLSCGHETVRRLVRAKALRAYRANRSPRAPLRFRQADVDDYLARRCV